MKASNWDCCKKKPKTNKQTKSETCKLFHNLRNSLGSFIITMDKKKKASNNLTLTKYLSRLQVLGFEVKMVIKQLWAINMRINMWYIKDNFLFTYL